jgi:hypothetical protein
MRTDLGIVAAARQVLADLRRSGRDPGLRAELERLLRESDEGHDVVDAIWRLLSDDPGVAAAMRSYLHHGSETMAIAPGGGQGTCSRDRADERCEAEVPRIDVDLEQGHAAQALPPHQPRWLNCLIYESVPSGARTKLEKSFKRNAEHELEAWVGPEVPGALVDKQGEPVDELLEGSARELTLYVQLPDSERGLAGCFVLPAEGPSKSVTFRFNVGDRRAYELKLFLYQAGRLLQQTVIKGKVLANPARAKTAVFTIGAAHLAAPSTQEQAGAERQVGIVSDRRADGRPTLAAFRHGRCAWFDDDRLSNITAGVTTLLDRLTRDSAIAGLPLDDQRIVSAFRALACLGAELRQIIEGSLSYVFGDRPLDRVQLTMARENDFVPLDFVYDFPAPATDATMCSNWRTGAAHACTAADHRVPVDPRGLSTVVCPHGFWGVSKIIERQVLQLDPTASTSPRDFVLALEDRSKRPALRLLSSGLLASSSKARQKDASEVLQRLTLVTGGNCDQATDWVTWAERFRGKHPALLVLLSHTDELLNMDALEIGGDVSNTGQLGQILVGSSPDYHPVVLLLGCRTNAPVRSARSIVTTFYGNNASLVVGTLTPVLAAHAPRVAERLLDTLAAADDQLQEGATIGDLLLDVRRRLLASGEPIALTLTALGDLDWRVAPRGR